MTKTSKKSKSNLPVPLIRVVAAPYPFKARTVETYVPVGTTVSGIIGRAKRDNIEVWIDGRYIEHVEWDVVSPNPGSLVNIKVLPGRNILRIALFIAVVVAVTLVAPEITPGIAAAPPGSLGFAAFTALKAGLTIAGMLLVNALVPPSPPPLANNDSFTRLTSLTGIRNRIAAFSPIPRVYGNVKYFPPIPMTATPFTEFVGDMQYLRSLFVLGYGPLDIGGVKVGDGNSATLKDFPVELGDNIKIGETKISDFEDVEVEIGEWQDITLYSRSANQQFLSVILNSSSQQPKSTVSDNISETRTTGTDAEEIVVDLEFPNGVFSFDKKGKTVISSVSFVIEYRLAGSADPWVEATKSATVDLPGSGLFWYRGWFNGNQVILQNELPTSFDSPNLVVRSSERKGLRRSFRWKVPKGQYDVRVTRKETYNSGDTLGSTDAVWTALKDFNSSKPFVVDNVILMAVRIKATDELSGSLDNLSVRTTSILPVWNGTSWVEQPTRTPAWIYADILSGSAARNPINKNTEMDLPGLLDWANWTEANGFYFDFVFDSDSTVFSRIREVCAAGRAAWSFLDNLFSVVREETGQVPVQVFTPRNTSQFGFQRFFPEIPDALRVQFVDENTFEDTERLVFNDGFDKTTSNVFQELPLRGVTNADQAWKLARFHLGQLKLRPETYKFTVPIENLIVRRGDAATLQHDALLVGLAAGRIKSVTRDGNGQVISFVTDEELRMTTGTNYGVKIRYIDGTNNLAIVQSQIQTVDPSTTLVTPVAPLPSDVKEGDLFIHGEFGIESIDIKIIRVEPSEDLTAILTAVPLAPEILNIDSGPIPPFNPFLTKPVDPISRVPAQPVILAIRSDEKALVRDIDGSLRVRILVSYSIGSDEGDPNLTIEARYTNVNNPQGWKRSTVRGDSKEITLSEDIEEGEIYEIQLRSVRGRTSSNWTVPVNHLVIGKSSVPADVSGFVSTTKNFGIVLSWDKNEELDVDGYEIREGSDWNSGALVSEVRGTKFIVDLNPLAPSRTFWIKAFDVAGNFSINAVSTVSVANLPTVSSPSFSFSGPNLRLIWNGNKGDHPIDEFEIRRGGTSFVNATPVAKSKGNSFEFRVDWLGSQTWRIAATDVLGNTGPAVSVSPTVNAPTVSNLIGSAIGNSVKLSWTGNPGSLPIQEYEIRKGDVFSTASVIGRALSTSTLISESSKGTFKYWVVPFDTAGNQGTEISSSSISVDDPSPNQSANLFHITTDGVVSSRNSTFSVGSEVNFGRSDGLADTFPNDQVYIPLSQLGISPDDLITATALITADFSNTGNNRLRLSWVNSSGSTFGVSDSAAISFPITDGLASVTGTVPVNAAYARLSVRIDAGTGTVSIRQAMMNRGGIAALYVPPTRGANLTAPQTANLLHVSTAGVVSTITRDWTIAGSVVFGRPDGSFGTFPDVSTYVPLAELGIKAGDVLRAEALFTANFTSSVSRNFRLSWFDSAGVGLGQASSTVPLGSVTDLIVTVTGMVPAGATHANISARIEGGTGTASLKRVMLSISDIPVPYADPTRGADNTSQALGASILKNGSFEAGFVGWLKSSKTSIVTGISHSGTSSVLVTEAEGSSTVGLFPDPAVNYIPARQGDRFLVSMWAKRNESDLPFADIQLSHREADAAKIVTAVSTVGFASKIVSGWQRISGTITVTNANTEFLVMLPVWGAPGIPTGQGGSWYVDDISIEKLPRTLDDVPDGSGRAGVDPGALTSGKVDLSKTGVINKVLDNIGDSATFRKTTINEADGGSRAFSALASGSLIADAVGFQDNLNSRRITRAMAVGSGINGQSFIFSPARQSIPKIRQRPGGEFGVPNPAGALAGLQWYKNIAPANATTAGFDLIARFEAVTSGTPVAITDTGATGTTGSSGSLVIVKSQSAEATNDTYTVQFDVTVGRAFENPLNGFVNPGSLEIAIDTRPAGGAWTQRATKFFQNNSTSSTFPKPDQKVDIVVDGLALNAEFRVRVTSEFSGDGAGSLDAFDSVKYNTPGSQITVTEPMTGSGRTIGFDVLDGEEDTLL